MATLSPDSELASVYELSPNPHDWLFDDVTDVLSQITSSSSRRDSAAQATLFREFQNDPTPDLIDKLTEWFDGPADMQFDINESLGHYPALDRLLQRRYQLRNRRCFASAMLDELKALPNKEEGINVKVFMDRLSLRHGGEPYRQAAKTRNHLIAHLEAEEATAQVIIDRLEPRVAAIQEDFDALKSKWEKELWKLSDEPSPPANAGDASLAI